MHYLKDSFVKTCFKGHVSFCSQKKEAILIQEFRRKKLLSFLNRSYMGFQSNLFEINLSSKKGLKNTQRS